MKILFVKYCNISESDTILSMQYMGHEVNTYTIKNRGDDYNIENMNQIKDELLKVNYDCVFSINFLPIVSRVCNIFKIKYISWGVDCPQWKLNSDTVKNECNYIFLFDKNQYNKSKDKNPGHIFYMPLGSNPTFFSRVIPSEEEIKEYSCDVSFVGSLYEEQQYYDKYKEHLSPYIQGFIDAGIQAQRNIYGYNIFYDILTDEMASECVKSLEVNLMEDYHISDKEIAISQIIGQKVSSLERRDLVDRLAKNFDFKLFTTSDTKDMPHVKNMGPLDSRLGMPKVFKLSKVNINTTIKTIESGIPLRVFDIMACGGFVISNYQSEIPEIFEVGRDLEVFYSMDDLVEKVSYYLKHEDERKQIAKNGYEKILKMYTVEHRLKEIFRIVYNDNLHSYGINKEEYSMDYNALTDMVGQLKMNSLLDVGLFFGKAVQMGLPSLLRSDIITDGLEIINRLDDVKNIYSKTYNLLDNIDGFYDIAIIYGILKYLSTDEIKLLLAKTATVAGTAIIEYKEDYVFIIRDNTSYNIQEINMNGRRFLLLRL